jgi:predicted MPP superfamily phosphohydrolase
VNHKTLRLPRKIPAAEGLKIGHLSDLHFTGQYRPQHYHFVIGQLMSLQPDLIFISGDIIDFQHCMPMVDEVLKGLSAPLGCYFVLGNHERRLKHVPTLVDRLTSLGFIDLGVSSHDIQVRDLRIQMLGNESPWFNRRATATSFDAGLLKPGAGASEPPHSAGETSLLRLGVAHTPDCIGWARRHRLDLLLAGHTHGGQARFPWIGPLVAPSLHGSKFASGVFLLPPTVMHVSRGVAGTHTIRWRCPPEVSVLKLTNP